MWRLCITAKTFLLFSCNIFASWIWFFFFLYHGQDVGNNTSQNAEMTFALLTVWWDHWINWIRVKLNIALFLLNFSKWFTCTWQHKAKLLAKPSYLCPVNFNKYTYILYLHLHWWSDWIQLGRCGSQRVRLLTTRRKNTQQLPTQ